MKEDATAPVTDWLPKLQRNDEGALAALMEHYYADLYHYAARFSQDDALIKDCIQEIFISLWQRRANATAITSPRYYLLGAVKNKVLKALSQNRTTAAGLHPDYDFFHEFSIEKHLIEQQVSEEKSQKLKMVVASLSKRQKEIIYLKFYQRLEHAQIAELLGISRQSVYNLLHEAILQLRKVWHASFVTR